MRVWYWNGEDPKEELDRRFAAAIKHYGLQREDVEDRLFIDNGRMMPIVVAEDTRSGLKIAQPVIDEVTATIRNNRIDVLIIDPFVSCHRVSENDNSAIERVFRSWATISEETNSANHLAHHTRKTMNGGVVVEDARGASALVNGARAARLLNAMSAAEAEKIDMPESEREYYFRADNGKRNLTPPAQSAYWYKFQSVNLENSFVQIPGVTGAGDDVGVVTGWEYPQVAEYDVTPNQTKHIHNEINGARYRASSQSKSEPWVGVAVANVLKLDLMKSADKRVVVKVVDDMLKAGRLKKVKQLDSRSEERDYVVPGMLAQDEVF